MIEFLKTDEEQSITLELIKKTHIKKIKNQNDAIFIRFEYLDLDTVDESDEDYFNLGVRDEDPQELNDRIDNLTLSFIENGWDISYFPPCFGTDGKPRDGRGRIITAKRLGIKRIPIAVYEYPDNTFRTNVTCGLIANIHPPAVRVKRDDIIEAGIELVARGELDPTDAEVYTWLMDEVLIEKIFKATKDITIILKAITRRCENGTPSLVKRGNSEQWKAWLLRHLGLVDRKDYILTSVDNIAYANRTWCENILPLIIKQKTPVNIICYSGEREPQKARSKMKQFKKWVDTNYEASAKMFNNISQPENKRPYRFLGAIPQIVGEHFDRNVEPTDLISVQTYINKREA